ncbi:MAG TPA: hypothetical protein VNS58_18860 [Puia sp.]|nr:hypothetical protein [Puia sp.]
MYVKKILLFILLSSGLYAGLQAQTPEKQRAVELLRSLSDRYRNYKSLHFIIVYKYSSEDKPGVYLDSLKGDFKMSGSSYRYILDSTEFIANKDLTVVLYKQDQVMFLSKTSPAMQSGNPMALLDSILLKNDSVNCQLTETKEQQKIRISFQPGLATRAIEYTIDRKSGFVTRMTQVVQSQQLYDPSVRSLVEGHSSYSIVETDFSNYREGDFDERELDLGRYFKREGNTFVTIAPYDSYKIFLGTPDL